MGALMPLAVALALSAAPSAPDPIDRWQPIIIEASRRFGVPTSWIKRVMRAESGGQTMLDGRPIRSRVGAIGLMQLMPATWRAMRERLALGANPDDPHDNIIAGVCYLQLMFERFGYPGLFAAYNAGPARYVQYRLTGRALPAETTAYLAQLSESMAAKAAAVSTPPSLFVIRYEAINAVPADGHRPSASSLFAVRESER